MTEISHSITGLTYLNGLNPSQLESVMATEGALLILAGAGTGKTKALTTRLAHILSSGLARPHEILTVTFTNKAALEMRERVSHLLGRPLEGWWLGTFHSLCARMLRRHAERVGLTPQFTIIDPDDQIRLFKQILEDEGLDLKKNPPKLIASVIERWKDKGLTPQQLSARDVGDLADGKMLKIYETYQNRLKLLNACDFGDLLLHVVHLLKAPEHQDILDQYTSQFKYILVDEYQDTNVVQYLWLRLLAQKHKNIACVGDDDQSIYGWRGAEIGNILRFEKDYPNAKIIRLEQNYRSTPTILKAANHLIKNNQGRLGKELWSAAEDGDKITVKNLWDGQSEASFIAETVEDLQRKKHPLRNIAVLVRASYQTREIEEKMIKNAIPYRVIGGLRFYERLEIRDALAYFRVTLQPKDDLAFERIINTPKRGVGNAALSTLFKTARHYNIALYDALLKLLTTDDLQPKVRTALRDLVDKFDHWRALLSSLSPRELAELILEQSGYLDMWRLEKTIEAQGRYENLKELITAIAEFGSLQDFAEHVALVMETQNNTNDDMVTIMTLHGAKGLEFETVFLPGFEEGLFPSQRTLDENGLNGLEEERRLAYVGLTRAKKRIYISYAANRLLYGSWTQTIPSRFIAELPPELLERSSEHGLSSQMHARSGGHSFYGGQKSFVIETTSARLESESGFSPKDRVFHQKFGYGIVIAVDHDKLDIAFEKAGRKKIMESFVSKA